jgi:tRNA(Ile)-lysidine synthase
MLELFLTFVNEEPALNKGVSFVKSCLLLTVSGGIDSVVMVDLCYRANIRFGIAHVNFGLRGEESDADEVFVRQLAQHYGVPFHRTQFDTKNIAHQRGISVQMTARELRYSWFNEVADAFGYDFIATAHHQNDVLETVLLNLVRGTGLAGLRGVPIRQGRIVRPLWFATRPEIFAYLQERGLQWRAGQRVGSQGAPEV